MSNVFFFFVVVFLSETADMERINTIYIFKNCVVIINLKQGIKKQNHQTIVSQMSF